MTESRQITPNSASSPSSRVQVYEFPPKRVEKPLIVEDSEDEPGEDLIALDVSYGSLNNYMRNIIEVVNQHAALINTLNTSIQMRPTHSVIKDLFQSLWQAFPYDALFTKLDKKDHTRPASGQ